MNSLVDSIAEDAARLFGTTAGDLLSRKRTEPETPARQAVMYVLHLMGWGPVRIQREMGFHHSTAIHARRVVQDRLDVSSHFSDETASLIQLWQSKIPANTTAPAPSEIYITVNVVQ